MLNNNAKTYPDHNLDEIEDLAEEISNAKIEELDSLFLRREALSPEDQEFLDSKIKELDLENCEHDEVDPMEGCLECGKPFHEVRNVDPDFDMER